jgi:hypothetical protein
MKRGSNTVLLSATIVLAAVTAALSSGPIRRDMHEHFAAERRPTWQETAPVVGASMSEDPGRTATSMDWRLRTGQDAWWGGKPLERRAFTVPASEAQQQQSRRQNGTGFPSVHGL